MDGPVVIWQKSTARVVKPPTGPLPIYDRWLGRGRIAEGWIRTGSMGVRVRIYDMRITTAGVQYLIRPKAGQGEQWVSPGAILADLTHN